MDPGLERSGMGVVLEVIWCLLSARFRIVSEPRVRRD